MASEGALRSLQGRKKGTGNRNSSLKTAYQFSAKCRRRVIGVKRAGRSPIISEVRGGTSGEGGAEAKPEKKDKVIQNWRIKGKRPEVKPLSMIQKKKRPLSRFRGKKISP